MPTAHPVVRSGSRVAVLLVVAAAAAVAIAADAHAGQRAAGVHDGVPQGFSWTGALPSAAAVAFGGAVVGSDDTWRDVAEAAVASDELEDCVPGGAPPDVSLLQRAAVPLDGSPAAAPPAGPTAGLGATTIARPLAVHAAAAGSGALAATRAGAEKLALYLRLGAVRDRLGEAPMNTAAAITAVSLVFTLFLSVVYVVHTVVAGFNERRSGSTPGRRFAPAVPRGDAFGHGDIGAVAVPRRPLGPPPPLALHEPGKTSPVPKLRPWPGGPGGEGSWESTWESVSTEASPDDRASLRFSPIPRSASEPRSAFGPPQRICC